jgi:hypothetical protein
MREDVLRSLAGRAARDPRFLRQMRKDPEATLARYGYDLGDEELRVLKNLQRQTAQMSDEELAKALADGFQRRTSDPPSRPAAPGPRGAGPARPDPPGGSARRR